MSDLAIIIVNWNTRQMLADCLTSINETAAELAPEIIVVDNNSTDGSQTMLAERFPQVKLIQNYDNAGFAKANNQAMALSRADYFLLLNSDALLLPNSAHNLLALAKAHPRAGIIGAHLRNADGTFQASHTPFPTLRQEFLILSGLGRTLRGPWYPSRGPQEEIGPQPVDYVEGACLLVNRAAYQSVGGLDEGFFMYAEEVDWCMTMRRNGWQVWYHPAAKVIHLGGGSSQNRRTQREADLYRSRVRLFKKHYGNTTALMLKWQIITLTAIKLVIHSVLRLFRRGRPVISLRQLVNQLKDV